MKPYKLLLFFCFFTITAIGQETFPVNGVTDVRSNYFAFTNATIVKDAQTILQNATMIIKQGKIVSVGTNISIPKDVVVIDCRGKFIYPSFIDLFSNYGIPEPQISSDNSNRRRFADQPLSNTKGAYDWNQAIKPETDASKLFILNENKAKAKDLRSAGFGAVISHQEDGIARGAGTLVTLGDSKENLVMLREKAAAFYSFNKGTSTQDYPTSLMGSIALLRQTFYDAQWYKTHPSAEGTNLSLSAWNDNLSLPQIFDANDKWNVLRADKIAKEFNVQYIIKGGGNEYQRIDEIKTTKASLILPINFPKAMDVEDPNDARLVALSDMKHWEMAPAEPGIFEKENINFAITSEGLDNKSDFLPNIRKAIKYGLSETKALDALTKIPAQLIGVFSIVGSLDAGKVANFIITNGTVFDDKTIIFQNWIQGVKYTLKDEGWNDVRGIYFLTINTRGTSKNYEATIKGTPEKPDFKIKEQRDTTSIKVNFSQQEKLVHLSWSDSINKGKINELTGIISENIWNGNGFLSNGDVITWALQFKSALPQQKDTTKNNQAKKTIDSLLVLSDVLFPFNGYGWKNLPSQEDIIIKNTTVWTNEKEGILQNTDVVISKGKIAGIGKNLMGLAGRTIDGSGKHLTAGIIDEHSHIAISGGVNECSQSVTSEVRVADVVDPEDIDIYRQLASGVTSAHLLHGSCNTIGGQTQLIKMRWGKDAEDLKFANWDPFIKFALGENVKRTYNEFNTRFPDTRMGVEQVLMDAFTRAKDYQQMGTDKRRDLKLDALVEILNHKRFITCHSYVQSEINMLMHVADTFGFKVNTFTHILEGYKVADKMKAHGAYASTFSDWWNYKSEVEDAIPYNMAIMTKVGLTVAVNSDDAEQARHLNQEAAKSIKYGNLTEEQALKICTLNPAIMLHVADRVGSIKVGKDADVVLWSDDPLSVYAKPLTTIIDGVIYYDVNHDAQMREYISKERARLIQKMINAKKNGEPVVPARMSLQQSDDENDAQ
ncbi:MAG: amidohydrolase family protein [Chitinophagaceae bacterium]